MKKYLLPTLYLLLILLFVSGTVWCLGFAHHLYDERTCENVRVNILSENGDRFITEDEIIETLNASKLFPNGHLTTLNTNLIEDFLQQNSAIQTANVFAQISGEIDINVQQRQPIVRVQNARNQQFYIGSDGGLMNINRNHSAPLIVANGYIFEAFSSNQNILKPAVDTAFRTLKKIFQLVTYIQNDEFLNTFIDQIYINAKQEFELVPKIGNHLILLGNAENYTDQFKRLNQFYEYGVKKVGWDAYKIINLKYNNQVVCSKSTL